MEHHYGLDTAFQPDKVSLLQLEMEGMEQARKDMAEDYERQLSSLRNDVANMRKDYEKLYKRYKEKMRQSDTDSSTEVRNLHDQLKEYQKRSLSWDSTRWTLEKQLELVQTENKTLNEKNQIVQQQLETYQRELELGANTQLSMKTHLMDLETQLMRSKEAIHTHQTQLARLKNSFNESMALQKRSLDEKERLEKEMDSAQLNIRSLDAQLTREKDRIETKDNEVRHWRGECDKLQQQTVYMNTNIIEKDHRIQQLTASCKEELDSKVQQLLSEIDLLKKSLRKHKSNEKTLLEESSVLQDQLDTSRKENQLLATELAAKIAELKHVESDEVQRLQQNIHTIKDDWSKERNEHENQVETLRKQLTQFTTDVHEKSVSINNLTATLAKTERINQGLTESLEKKEAELHVANAQVDALRLENRHLKKSTLSSCRPGDGNDSTRHLSELQQAYQDTIQTMEKQNQQLESELANLKDKVKKADDRVEEIMKIATKETEERVRELQRKEHRTLKQLEEAHTHQVHEMQERLRSTIAQYEHRLKIVNNNNLNLEKEMKKLKNNFQLERKFGNRLDDIDDSVSLTAADEATANYLEEANRRTKDLEQILILQNNEFEKKAEELFKKYHIYH